MAFVNMKCPNCGGVLQQDAAEAAQFECPYCHATVLNVLDVKVEGDVEKIDADEFVRRLNEQKKKFVIRVDRQYKVVDVKTAVINLVHGAEQRGESLDREGLAASFCKAVSDSLVPRTMQAARELGYKTVVVAGGVAANSRIRRDFAAAAEREGVTLYIPPLKLCGDNAAMIGAQAYYEYKAGSTAGSDLNAYATKEL